MYIVYACMLNSIETAETKNNMYDVHSHNTLFISVVYDKHIVLSQAKVQPHSMG